MRTTADSTANGAGAQLAYHINEEVEIGRRRAPVAYGRAQRDMSTVDGGTGEDASVVEQRLAEATVHGVERVLGDIRRTIAETHHVEGHVGQSLEVRRLVDPCR